MDNTLILLRAEAAQIRWLLVLHDHDNFTATTMLAINFHKSNIHPIQVGADDNGTLASTFGLPCRDLP